MIKLKIKDFIKKASTFSQFANPEGTRLTKEIKNIKGNVESSSLPNFPKDIYGREFGDPNYNPILLKNEIFNKTYTYKTIQLLSKELGISEKEAKKYLDIIEKRRQDVGLQGEHIKDFLRNWLENYNKKHGDNKGPNDPFIRVSYLFNNKGKRLRLAGNNKVIVYPGRHEETAPLLNFINHNNKSLDRAKPSAYSINDDLLSKQQQGKYNQTKVYSSSPFLGHELYGHALADNLGNNGLYTLNYPDFPVNILKEELPDDSDTRTPKYLRAIKPSYFSHPREAAGFESRLARYLRRQNNKGMPYDNESQDALNIMKNPNFKFENNPSLQLDFNRYQNDLKNKSKEYKDKFFEEISNRIPYLAFNNINNSNMNINQLHNKFNKTAAAGLASAIATNNDPAKDPASRAGDMWQGALTSELGAGTGGALGLVLAQLLAKNAKPGTQALAAILGALGGYAGGGILGHKASKALAANRDKKREELLNKKTASSLSSINNNDAKALFKNTKFKKLIKLLGGGARTIGSVISGLDANRDKKREELLNKKTASSALPAVIKTVAKAPKNINLKNLAKLLGVGAGTIGAAGLLAKAKDIENKINLHKTNDRLMASLLGSGAGLVIGNEINARRKSKSKLLPLILALGGGAAGLTATGGIPSLEELKNYGNFAKDELVKDTKSIYNKASSGIENLINKLKSKN